MVNGLITQTSSTTWKHPKAKKVWDKLICQEALELEERALGKFNNLDLFQLCTECYLLRADKGSQILKATTGMPQRASYFTIGSLPRTNDQELDKNTLQAVDKVWESKSDHTWATMMQAQYLAKEIWRDLMKLLRKESKVRNHKCHKIDLYTPRAKWGP